MLFAVKAELGNSEALQTPFLTRMYESLVSLGMPMEAVILSQWRRPQDYNEVFSFVLEKGLSGINPSAVRFVWDMAILELFMHIALTMNNRCAACLPALLVGHATT